jgi:hypothetical protein
MKSIKLSSGNVYYYEDTKNDFIPFGFIVSQDDTFKGGFLGLEAKRKYAVFSKLANVEIQEQSNYDLSKVKLEEFAEKLGAASSSFIKGFNVLCNDRDDADGTDSTAESCDDRSRYYKTVGLESAFKSKKQFQIGLFIANHIAIFGVANFRYTFFKGKDDPSKDDELDNSSIFMKNVYAKCGFKAPAAYVRALLQGKL